MISYLMSDRFLTKFIRCRCSHQSGTTILLTFSILLMFFTFRFSSCFKVPKSYFNPFVPNAPFSLPLPPKKTSENLKVLLCFQGVDKGCIGNKWLNEPRNNSPGLGLKSKPLEEVTKNQSNDCHCFSNCHYCTLLRSE